LVCIVDDGQWLDKASGQVLSFIGRRLLAEPVAIVCAVRSGEGDTVLAGLPEIQLDGLGDDRSRALLSRHLHGTLDAVVHD
jgi:hypothetical protein